MTDKVLKKSLELSLALFPEVYSSRKSYRTYHFALGWRKSRLLGVGINQTEKESKKALNFAIRYGTRKQQIYKYLHAEIDLISKLFGRYYIDGNMRLVLVRINKEGETQNSKPCSSCQTVLDSLGVTRIDYTTKDGWESI